MSKEPIRIIIADDHTIMREGLVQLLSDHSDIEVAGTAENGHQAVDLAAEVHPDVALLDVAMEEMTGLEAARLIKNAYPDIKVIMVTMHDEKAFLEQAMRVGASGYFLKGSDSEELIQTIRLVMDGGTYLAPSMTGI